MTDIHIRLMVKVRFRLTNMTHINVRVRVRLIFKLAHIMLGPVHARACASLPMHEYASS